jgi:hypothetical protein
MPIFLCRWPNGEFSIVNATSKGNAIELLDEWANAESAKIIRMPDCMFDFRLNDRGDIELSGIGEATEEFVRETCYPELEHVLDTAERDDGDFTQAGLEQIRAAVEHERKRLYKDTTKPKLAETELGRDLQRELDMASATANRHVRRRGREILQNMKTDGKKVQ